MDVKDLNLNHHPGEAMSKICDQYVVPRYREASDIHEDATGE